MPEDKNVKHLNGRSLTASEYYYDCPSDTWDNMNYRDAIEDRYERAKQLYFKLYNSSQDTFDDQVRFHKVQKAYNDTKQLLDERSLVI